MAHASSRASSVLLVDGYADDRDMYAEYLRICGFDPDPVDNCDDALAHAADADVIVTGIRVPGSFDGVELVRRLRQSAETRHTPIIVLTACAFEPDRERARQAGCDAFLPKPCLPDHLVAEVRRVLAQSRRLVAESPPHRSGHKAASAASARLHQKSAALVERSKRLHNPGRTKNRD